MNVCGSFLAIVAVVVLWQIWRAHTIVQAHLQASEAWERANDLLRQRRDFAHQLVIYSETIGWWDHATMEKLLKASAEVRAAKDRNERLVAERALGHALRQAIDAMATGVRGDEDEDLALMANYWNSTERKLDFARRYYNTAAERANRRLNTRLAKTLVRFRAVRSHETFAPDELRVG